MGWQLYVTGLLTSLELQLTVTQNNNQKVNLTPCICKNHFASGTWRKQDTQPISRQKNERTILKKSINSILNSGRYMRLDSCWCYRARVCALFWDSCWRYRVGVCALFWDSCWCYRVGVSKILAGATELESLRFLLVLQSWSLWDSCWCYRVRACALFWDSCCCYRVGLSEILAGATESLRFSWRAL